MTDLDALAEEIGTSGRTLRRAAARGAEQAGSDVDLLVELRGDGSATRAELRERLEGAAGRRVQLVGLAEAERSPLLLADVLRGASARPKGGRRRPTDVW